MSLPPLVAAGASAKTGALPAFLTAEGARVKKHRPSCFTPAGRPGAQAGPACHPRPPHGGLGRTWTWTCGTDWPAMGPS